MLHRSLHRSLRPPAHTNPLPIPFLSPSTTQCAVCTCRCGARFRRTTPIRNETKNHERGYATKRRAPSTRLRQDELRGGYLTPAEARRERERTRELEHGLDKEILHCLEWCYEDKWISIPAQAVLDYLIDVDHIKTKAKGRPTLELGAFNELLEKHGLSHDEAFAIAKLLVLMRLANPEYMFLGKKMMLTLSRLGHALSTLTIVAQAVLQAKKKPGILKGSEIAFSRAHLRQLVLESSNYKAMVLEGNVANAEGDENRAIRLWTQAMAAAVEESEAVARARGKSGNAEDRTGPSLDEEFVSQLQLSSPWIELLLVHMERSKRRGLDWAHEIAQCEWAMAIGCEQSDPDAHYYAATYNTTQDGYSSEWLYHMTKAASSGHWKAAHELAEFYTNTGWKYLDDEPPDDMKPTPFDSYPAGRSASWWDKALEFVGLKQTSTRDSKRDLFHAAAYPSSDAGRFRLAMMWLEFPLAQFYAPSYLHKAKMCMVEKLWSKSNTPKSALQLNDDRYAYASREDYETGKLIDERWVYESEDDREARKPSFKTSSPEPEGEPNPYYDLEEAKKALREVFWAYRAYEMVKKDLAAYESRRLRGLSNTGVDEEMILGYGHYRNSTPAQVWKWLLYPEVRDKYIPVIEQIYSEAKAICDSEGWDLYDEHNALVYKARRK